MPRRSLIVALALLLLSSAPVVVQAAGGKRVKVTKRARTKRTGLAKRLMAAVVATTMLTGCIGPFDAQPPKEPTQACKVFEEKGIGWYKDLKAASAKYDVPKELILAIAYRESTLDADARGKASYKLFDWPMVRRAKGMAQVMPSTFQAYKASTGGGMFTNPDSPATAFDIIGWHAKQTTQEIGKPHLRSDPVSVAQMHHGGSGAYGSSKYLGYAQDVAKMTAKYKSDFASCGAQLDQEARPLLQKMTDGLKDLF